MSFKREILPSHLPSGNHLSENLSGIGFRINSVANKNANIEDSLIAASIEGLAGDYRTLSLLVQWFGIHSKWVNADRLIKLIQSRDLNNLSSFWSGVAKWQSKDHRFKKLIQDNTKSSLILGSEYNFQKHGEDPRFVGTSFKVPQNLLRDRARDILNPKELAEMHACYRYRVMMGPSYSSDMWAELEKNPSLSATELAKITYGSFATAWNVIRARKIVA